MKMIRKSICLMMAIVFCCGLSASEVSEKKIRIITKIVRGEFKKMVVIPQGKKARPWQYPYDPKTKNASYTKIKNAIYTAVKKKVIPFETKARQDGIPPKVRTEIARSVAKRFPYKSAADIALGALKEAEIAYPLVKTGDDVTIRYYRNNIYSKISGKVQSIREGGQIYEIGNKLVRISEIVESDRLYFDPGLNAKLRQEFIRDFQDPKKLAKLKRDYASHLTAEALEKVVANEKKGYIFFRDKWVTAKYVTDQLIIYYQKITEKRVEVESSYIIRGVKAPAKKKK